MALMKCCDKCKQPFIPKEKGHTLCDECWNKVEQNMKSKQKRKYDWDRIYGDAK